MSSKAYPRINLFFYLDLFLMKPLLIFFIQKAFIHTPSSLSPSLVFSKVCFPGAASKQGNRWGSFGVPLELGRHAAPAASSHSSTFPASANLESVSSFGLSIIGLSACKYGQKLLATLLKYASPVPFWVFSSFG